MLHERFPRATATPLATFASDIIVRLILAAQSDPSEMKTRIMIAWEHGHLTPAQAEAMIVAFRLEAA